MEERDQDPATENTSVEPAAPPSEPDVVEEAAPSPVAQPAPTPEPPAPVVRKTTDERKQLLAQAIQTQVAGGARVESQSDYQAVLIKGHRPNHTLHFIIGLVTLGLWWLVWAGIAIFGGEKRQMVQADEFGNVTVQQL